MVKISITGERHLSQHSGDITTKKMGTYHEGVHSLLMRQEMRQQVQHPKTKQVWIIKRDEKCLVVCTSLKTKAEEEWYFNSGSSRHMTDSREFLINL